MYIYIDNEAQPKYRYIIHYNYEETYIMATAQTLIKDKKKITNGTISTRIVGTQTL